MMTTMEIINKIMGTPAIRNIFKFDLTTDVFSVIY